MQLLEATSAQLRRVEFEAYPISKVALIVVVDARPFPAREHDPLRSLKPLEGLAHGLEELGVSGQRGVQGPP